MAVKLTGAIPVLPSRDIEESLAFYKKIGFDKQFKWGDEGVAPSYGGAIMDEAFLHFFQCGKKEVCEWTSCRVETSGVKEYYEQCKKVEGAVHPNGALEKKPWGYLEFAVLDPSGVCVTFAERLEEE